jgi:hypothetical protein
MNERLDQDLIYYQSLHADQLKDIKKQREQQRQQVQKILESKIPSPLERLLNRDQTRIYRLYQMSPDQLTEGEKIQGKIIFDYFERVRSGGCYNLSSEQEQFLKENNRLFTFKIPSIGVTLGIDITGPINNELVNVSHKMVDIFIENDRYPFDDETSQLYLKKLNIDPLMYPQMKFSNLENTETEIQSIMLQLHPELIT